MARNRGRAVPGTGASRGMQPNPSNISATWYEIALPSTASAPKPLAQSALACPAPTVCRANERAAGCRARRRPTGRPQRSWWPGRRARSSCRDSPGSERRALPCPRPRRSQQHQERPEGQQRGGCGHRRQQGAPADYGAHHREPDAVTEESRQEQHTDQPVYAVLDPTIVVLIPFSFEP